MKRSFFQAAVCVDTAIWMHHMDAYEAAGEEADGNYTRMLRAVLNKSWRQHPTRLQLYGHLPPSQKLYKFDEPDTRDTAGEARTSSISDVLLYGPPLMDVQVWDDQHELTYSSYVRTRVVILKTCRRRWVIGRNGERRSGISAQTARHDDDDDK